MVPEETEYMLEIIGHCSVSENHVETLVKTMTVLQKSNDNLVGALGVKVDTREGELGIVESWIEILSSPLGSGNGQFENFLELRKLRFLHFVCILERHWMMLVVGIHHLSPVRIVIYLCDY